MSTVNAVITLLASEAGSVSKTPFYVAGGVLVAWAVVLSAFGLTRPDFPRGSGGGRAVMAISGVLVLATLGTAIGTSSKPHEKQAEAKSPAAEPVQTTPATGGAGATLELSADPGGQLKFQESELEAQAGKVAINFDNQSQVPHNVAVEAAGKELGKSETITGAKTTLELDLKPGTYEFFCTVDSHRDLGMKGTLTVS